MNAVVAVYSKRDDAASIAVRMMDALRHRGNDQYGLASESGEVWHSRDLPEFSRGHCAIGFNLRRLLKRDIAQPATIGTLRVCMDGRIYPGSATADIQRLPATDARRMVEWLFQSESEHALVGLEGGRIFACRDAMGLRPLYWGENADFVALASERKALWRVGVKEVRAFPPGTLAYVAESISFRRMRELKRDVIQVDDQEAITRVDSLLSASARKRLCDLDAICIAFSGGLDSALTLHYARGAGCKVRLLSVGLEGSQELAHAEMVAEEMEESIEVEEKGLADVEGSLGKVLWSVEEADPMKVQVAIPLHWVGEAAARRGWHFVAAGQGSDELYGGYRRFAQLYGRSGPRAVEEAIFQAVVMSHEVNFQRDEQTFAANGVELRLPFTDWELVQFSVSLPLHLKVLGPDDMKRKWVLRKLAERIGLPGSVAERKKIAVQHGTGVSRALERIARQQNLTLREYLDRRLHSILRQAS